MKITDKGCEKINIVANLVEEMYLSHAVKDETKFKKSHGKASKLLFEVLYEEIELKKH